MIKKIDKYTLWLGALVVIFIVASFFVLKPKVAGDGLTYLDTINFLTTGEASPQFIPNRIITTFGGLEIIVTLSKIFGSYIGVWFAMNTVFYALSAFIFYNILILLFNNHKVAFLGSIFFIGNYAMLTFGLNYLMDMGGWAFYLTSLFCMISYAKFGHRSDLLWASAVVGVGGLFKEYALLGVIPIAVFLIYENPKSILLLLKNSIVPALLSTIPIISLYSYSYLKFGYTYADWIKDSYKYSYSSSSLLRAAEYIKSFGSLYNILFLFVLAGIWTFWNNKKLLDQRNKIFIYSTVLSFLPVFLWGGVTQRILFITVPAAIIFACFFFEKYQKNIKWFYFSFVIYLLLNLFMDSWFLNVVNLPF